MIKNIILAIITALTFQGCVFDFIGHATGLTYNLNHFHAGEQEEIKAQYLALNDTQKEKYLSFIKNDCLLEAELVELDKKKSKFSKDFMDKYYGKDRNNYLTLEHLSGERGHYWSYDHWKETRQDRARAVKFCHNEFFKENNITTQNQTPTLNNNDEKVEEKQENNN
ncbi:MULTISPECIES: hypothetical protein [Aliarcobacter]|nr:MULTISPECIES: hypothetical protein [Aliarcobacter]MCT7484296.1 hypothetical protein [Aliarcobacter cryaerophilus]MCT7532177.1 hypothetical protein [Aliarcobacter cryaerophilus]MCT7632071.1 hypothetical protein [Aliarcobacter butzleri]